jgi:hypothetical protein
MCLGAASLAGLAALALGAPAAAQLPPAGARPSYPVHVEIALTRKAAGMVFQHGIGESLFAPPNPSCSVPVGAQARDAYAAVARRMFRADGSAGASLEIDVGAADLDLDLDGWHAQVEHALVLRSASGAEMGRWVVKGRERVAGLGETAIPRAFRAAADGAARRFEASFAEPPGVARWLGESGVDLASAPRPQPPPPDVPLIVSRPPGPPRTWALFVDLGAGSYFATEASNGRDQRTVVPALSVRVGGAAPWGFVEAMRARTSDVVDKTGVEAGPLFRLRPQVDFKVGGGVQRVSASRTSSVTIGSALAALSMALPVTKGTLWMRLGVEARYDFGPSLMLPTEDGHGRFEAARGGSVWASLGFELGTPD